MYGVYSQQASGGASAPEVIIIGGTNSRIFRSTDDGLTFSEQTVYHPSQPSTAVAWNRVYYCNGKFFISGAYGCMVSHDYGLTWENVINAEQMLSIVWNGAYYFAGFNYQIRRSADLVSWTNLSVNQGSAYQNGDDLCVVGEDVYWSTRRKTTTPVSFLSIQKCVAPYNQANISTINVPNSSSIPNGTNGKLYKTSNGLILTTSGGGTQQRIYSTTNYTTLAVASSTYNTSMNGSFDIVVDSYAYKFGPTSQIIKGYGSPVISTLSSTTAPNNTTALSVDTDGLIYFVATVSSAGNNIWIRGIQGNGASWWSADVGVTNGIVFYTGKSFLVINSTSLRRSETGTSGWSTAITPFGGYGNATNFNMASSYKI